MKLEVLAALAVACVSASAAQETTWMKEATAGLEKELVARYGEGVRGRAARGLKQAASFWRQSDGNRAEFEEFVRKNFAGNQQALDTLFDRCEKLFEQYDGHMLEIQLAFRTQV